ncbi:polysaccharide pyruvyl transferase family protein [Parabacteroides merdae]|uniref:polysaccharide pyruvyl transferase family protein n=1 Tax=Parabacteroides merdae TaxID=46503 RepID=UPI001899F489|nr:polysaccharide pyruvyl transferase family protein [Parabacteroides merdae]
MKIGIITFHRAENYGSVLQAYALNLYIRMIIPDAEVEEVDYESEAQHKLYRIFTMPKSILGFARFVHTLCNYRALACKKKKFADFVDKYIPLSDIHGNITEKELRYYATKYDFLICGSDQIWNIRCADSNEFYFLSFATEKTKKIAYAPSLGLSNFNRNEEELLKTRLSSFDYLSTRESMGAQIISRLVNKNVEVVCDPVLLFSASQWRQLTSGVSPIKEPYILCYFIGDIKGMRQYVKRVKQETGITKIIVIVKNLRDIKSRYTTKFDTGPIEFLNLIEHASYVITDSFHATCFSLLFHTKFWVFVESNSMSKPNSRIYNILKIADCQERILTNETVNRVDVDADIDFSVSDTNIESYSLLSKKYLDKALL